MTKLKTAVQNPTFEMTPAIETYLQEQIDFLSQLACNQLGTIANYANIAGFQTIPTFEQMFGDSFGLANDSNQRELKYAASTVANSPDMLVQVKPTGNVYGTQDAPSNWQYDYSELLVQEGFKSGKYNVALFWNPVTDCRVLVHSRFPCTGRPSSPGQPWLDTCVEVCVQGYGDIGVGRW